MISYRQRLKNPINSRIMKRTFVYIAIVLVALLSVGCGDDTSKPDVRPEIPVVPPTPQKLSDAEFADKNISQGQLYYSSSGVYKYMYVGKGRLHVKKVTAKKRDFNVADYPSITVSSKLKRFVGGHQMNLLVTGIDLDDGDPYITWVHFPALDFWNGINHMPSTLILEEGVDSIINMYPIVDELKDLWLPSTFKYIGPNAFEQKLRAFNQLYNFPDSMRIHVNSLEDWCKISIDTANVRVNLGDGNHERPFVFPYFTLCVGDDIVSDLVIPSSITKIGPCAFSGSRIKTVVLHDGVTEIGSYAFGFCKRLTSIKFSYGLKKIGPYSFYRCNIPEAFEIPSSVESIGAHAFSRAKISEITIPASVKKLEDETFSWCSLKEVHLPSGMVSIGNSAFFGSRLTTIDLPESLREIGDSVFAYSTIREITIPDNLEQIPREAFYCCDSLRSVTLPKGLKTVKEKAFFAGMCDSLTDIYCPCDTPPKIEGGRLFFQWKPGPPNKVRLHVPAGAVNKYKAAEGWNVCDIVSLE